MANTELLEEYRKNSGKTKKFLAQKLGVSRPKLDKLFAKPESATYGQAIALSNELDVEPKNQKTIFLP